MASRCQREYGFEAIKALKRDCVFSQEGLTQTERRNYHGRVAIGHATKLSALPPDALKAAAARLAGAGVAVTVLPATDLYLMGRESTHNVPRGLTAAHRLVQDGVLCSVATNNVLNPFTPFGDCSLLRMANFYANVAQAAIGEFDTCLDLVTASPARLMNLKDYGIAPGHPADMVVLDTRTVQGRDRGTAGHPDGLQERPPHVRAKVAGPVPAVTSFAVVLNHIRRLS
jgi:cytosine/adenosine deaminase-related metal-dependent hydrolase